MSYFLIGLFLLAVFVLAVRAFTSANPAKLARQLSLFAGIIVLLAGGFLVLRGLFGYAAPLLALGAALFWGGGRSIGNAAPSSGQTSQVVTDYLEMELDHDTGAIRGRILKGMFQGERIENLRPADLALLWQDCRVDDAQSATIIEAYLDQTHPSWREDVRRGEERMSSGPDGRMGLDEAYEILGLRPGASADDIRQAHRELILKLHPDRGGSTYLASKINEAKDVLLDQVG